MYPIPDWLIETPEALFLLSDLATDASRMLCYTSKLLRPTSGKRLTSLDCVTPPPIHEHFNWRCKTRNSRIGEGKRATLAIEILGNRELAFKDSHYRRPGRDTGAEINLDSINNFIGKLKLLSAASRYHSRKHSPPQRLRRI